MTYFEWLLVGHLVGDWLLQNDWMVRLKQNGLWNRAIFVHCLIYTLVLVLVHLGASSPPIALPLFVSVVFFSHWIIDAAGLAPRWMRLFGQTDVSFMRIAVDQVMHILVLAALAALAG